MKRFAKITETMELIKSFRRRSLFKQYFRICFIFTFIPLLFIYFFLNFYQIQRADIVLTSERNNHFSLTKKTLTTAFDTINKLNYQLIINPYVNAFVHAPEITVSTPFKETKQIMNNITLMSSYIKTVNIYSFENDYVLSTHTSCYINELPSKEWYDYYIKTKEPSFFITAPHPNNPEKTEICMCTGIYKKEQLYGLVILHIAADDILTDYSDNNKYYIINSQDTILYSTLPHETGKKANSADSEYLKQFVMQKNSGDTVQDLQYRYSENSKHFLCEPFFNNLYFAIESYTQNPKLTWSLIPIILGYIIFLLLLSMTLAFYISNKFYKSISTILSYFSISDSTEIEKDFIENTDELKYVHHNIRNILYDKTKLEEDLLSKTMQLKAAQTIALQSQFSSHFLFNTLNLVSMKAIALTKSENDISTIISLLSDLLFTALHSEKNLISVNEEIEFAKKFVQIESMRYNYNFDVIWDIDENVLNCYTLKLVLQPIIENAFTHGILKLPSDIRGLLTVSAELDAEKQHLEFTITDNGNTSEENIKNMQDILENSDISINSPHIGISNVNSRIKLLFNQSYGCSVKRQNEKTIFKIKLPTLISNNISDKF